MKAEIISIGTELLLGQITDTHAAFLGAELASLGISHTHRQTVGDNLDRIVEAIQLAMSRSDVVLTIGGLGPTADDLTREAIAEALGEVLALDEAQASALRANYAHRGVAMVQSQFRQAYMPASAVPILNANGTAPGLHVEKEGKQIFALPGPRNEFVPMLTGYVRRALTDSAGEGLIHSSILRVVGIGEAALAEKVGSYLQGEDVTVAPYAKIGEVHLRVTSKSSDPGVAQQLVAQTCAELRILLKGLVYGENDQTLESVLIDLLAKKGHSVAVAESCTGGLLGGRLTSVDGSSSVFKGGMVTYAAETKMRFLGVQGITIATHGTVSEECANEMALGVRGRFDSTYGVSITGVAGADSLMEPSGEKPSGLVFIGLSRPSETEVYRYELRGSRETTRERAVGQALFQLYRSLEA